MKNNMYCRVQSAAWWSAMYRKCHFHGDEWRGGAQQMADAHSWWYPVP
jgi:hypothetical protein